MTEDFIHLQVEELLGWFRVLEEPAASRLFDRTVKRTRRHRRLLAASSYSRLALYREAFLVMCQKRNRMVRDKAEHLHAYLRCIGFSEDDVARIMGEYHVVPVLSPDSYTMQKPETNSVEAAHGSIAQLYTRLRTRRQRFLVLTSTVMALGLMIGIVSACPALRQLTCESTFIQSMRHWWTHRHNPYVDWLPFVPMLPSSPVLGTPDVTVNEESSSETPMLSANYASSGVEVEVQQVEDLTFSTDGWKALAGIANVRVDPSGRDFVYTADGVAYLFYRTTGQWNRQLVQKVVESLKPYRVLPELVLYQASGAAHELDFTLARLHVPTEYHLQSTHLLKATTPSTGVTYEVYEWTYSIGESNRFLTIDQSTNANWFMKHFQSDLYEHRLPNEGTLEVFDSGKSTSVIVPGTTSFMLFTSGDNVSFLKRIASQDLPRT